MKWQDYSVKNRQHRMLTDSQAREVFERYHNRTKTREQVKDIAQSYGILPQQVQAIARRRTYRNATESLLITTC